VPLLPEQAADAAKFGGKGIRSVLSSLHRKNNNRPICTYHEQHIWGAQPSSTTSMSIAYRMSKPNTPSPALHAATGQHSLEDLGKAGKHSETSVYRAPYNRNKQPIPGQYIVTFRPGYMLAEHFAFLGFKIEVTRELDRKYLAALNDQVFNAVRYDPGVEFIEDDVYREEVGDSIGVEESDPICDLAAAYPKHPETSVYQAPYYPYPECRNPGEYLVTFQPGYTLAEHFTFLGFEVDLIGLLNNGYYAALDDQVFNAIRYDPWVKFIEDGVLGEVD
jgi:hypothetical protein